MELMSYSLSKCFVATQAFFFGNALRRLRTAVLEFA